MHTQIALALDLDSTRTLPHLLRILPPKLLWFKVGLELFSAEGVQAIHILKKASKRVFLDLKLHDIPNTTAAAVRTAARHGVGLLTLHATGGRAMLRAAAAAARDCGPDAPRLLAVTTLTSLDQQDLADIGVTRPLPEHTLKLGTMAIESGVDGLVCSVHEARQFRMTFGTAPLLVTPGIRPAGSPSGDQKRVATPRDAVQAGADFIVVGRPILAANDPAAAANEILRDLEMQSDNSTDPLATSR